MQEEWLFSLKLSQIVVFPRTDHPLPANLVFASNFPRRVKRELTHACISGTRAPEELGA